jgi:hypothetical protein
MQYLFELIEPLLVKLLGQSYATSVLGWVLLVGTLIQSWGVLTDGDLNTMPDWNQIVVALAGVGFVLAKDANVTGGIYQNRAGIKPKPIPPPKEIVPDEPRQ